MLRIALLNSADHAGGAETVVRLLRDGLRCRGHRTDLWVGRRKHKEDPEHTRALPCTDAQRQVAKRFAGRGFYSLGLPASVAFCESPQLTGVDLAHLHNLHGHYFSITAVPLLAGRVPLVWTFHDFFPITGGCAFPHDCERWLTRCGSCPQLGSYPISGPFDRTRRMQAIKRQAFRHLPVTIVTPSEHLGRAVKRSGIFAGADFRTIPYGVDTKVFYPHRTQARSDLGLSHDRPVVLLAAQGLTDPRKGIGHAIQALRAIDTPNLTVILAGADTTHSTAPALSGHDVRAVGYVNRVADIATYYAAADLFLFTSLAENYPCSVQEAMACGTAVLAFDINGVTEQITPDQTGFLVPTGNTDALGRAAAQLLADCPRLARVGKAARTHAVSSWDLDTFLDRHERLYRDMTKSSPRECPPTREETPTP